MIATCVLSYLYRILDVLVVVIAYFGKEIFAQPETRKTVSWKSVAQFIFIYQSVRMQLPGNNALFIFFLWSSHHGVRLPSTSLAVGENAHVVTC